VDIKNAYKILYLKYLEHKNSRLTWKTETASYSKTPAFIYKATWPPHQQGCDKILTAIKTLKSHNIIKTVGLPAEILTRDFQYTKQFSCNFIG
jgi:hypothetical protein